MRSEIFYTRLLLKRMGIILLLFFLCRLLFFVGNYRIFSHGLFDVLIAFFHGIRFDISAILYLNSPFILVSLLTRPRHSKTASERILKWLFYIVNSLALLFNLIDLEYFKFTRKRITADFFGTGNDFWALLPDYIKTYGYLVLILAAMVFILVFLYRKTSMELGRKGPHQSSSRFYIRIPVFCLLLFLTITGMRGGWQIKPVQIISASYYGDPENAGMVLNTPFTFIQTLGKKQLEPKAYFTQEEADRIWQPVQQFVKKEPFTSKNVVLIILESISKEWVGYLNNGKGYTPFLDSLCSRSIVFENAFANGKKSNEALPSLLAGIPSLMEEAYTGSVYQDNRLKALPEILAGKGYHTAFFHGGTNGTMNFDMFARQTGIVKYYGMNQYPDKKDFDGSWGIYDEPFFRFTADVLNSSPKPFFAGIFSLSSHHPYKLPERYKTAFPEVKDLFFRSIRYTDQALGKFFSAAEQMPWFHNTIFIITADHTYAATDPVYSTSVGFYRIPLIFYEPEIEAKRIKKVIQHSDIMPTVLDYLNCTGKFVSFGRSAFAPEEGFAVNYLNGIYQIIDQRFVLRFDGEQTVGFFEYGPDPMLQQDRSMKYPAEKAELEKKIKVYIQQFNRSLIENKLYPE